VTSRVALQDFATAHYGKALKQSDREESGQVAVFGSSGVVGMHDVTLVSNPTLIIGRKGSVGSVTYAPNGGWPIDTTFYLEITKPDEVDLRYLFWALSQAQLDRWTITTSIPGLSRDDLYRTRVPLPPLAEQRRIAAILDKADVLRRKRREAIGLLDEFLRSAFLEMFGDPVRNEKGWDTEPLGNVAHVNRGKFTPRPRNDPRFYGGEYPFIQTGDIAQADGYLTSWTQTLNSDGIAVSRAFDRGAVVTAIVGATIGETAILGLHAYAPDSVVGIEAGSRVLPEFIEYILRFWKPIFRAKAPETARANINLETLRPLTVPVPPLDDQQRFAQMYARVKQLDKAVPLADDLFNSLSQRAFRGEV